MKYKTLIIASLILLSGCGTSSLDNEDVARKMPRIPDAPSAKASIIDSKNGEDDIDEMMRLIQEIDDDLNRPNITEEDIRRGWYLGSEEDKKYGTPVSWIWHEDGDNSRWTRADELEEESYYGEREICIQSAGTYIISCIETEVPNCEYIQKNKCECIEGTEWVDNQGCIMTDEAGEPVAVTQEELNRGWYNGLTNQKKLNTPSSWVWVEAGPESRWQNPGSK